MPKWYDGFTNGNVELRTKWTVQNGGFHISTADSPILKGNHLKWRTGDLDGLAKRISRSFSCKEGATVSLAWAFLFQLDAATVNDTVIYHLMANERAIDSSSATYNANALVVAGDGTMTVLRYDGGGASTNILNPGWSADTEEHLAVVSREVSGANRYWRLYLDPPIDNLFDSSALVSGPTDDATYSTTTCMGVEHGTTNRQKTAAHLMWW